MESVGEGKVLNSWDNKQVSLYLRGLVTIKEKKVIQYRKLLPGHSVDILWNHNNRNYKSFEVQRDSFIIPGMEEFFSALTQNLAFFPRKLMARFPAQNGSQLGLGRKLNGILLKIFHA